MTPFFPVRVGELSYHNTVPFRLDARWNPAPCPAPRLLARWAEENRVDAGVLPVVDAWRLSEAFEPVGSFGIAAHGPAMSVLLFSKRPWDQLENARVGLTDESSTSAQLLRLLLTQRDNRRVEWRTGFSPTDDARLIIGDAALCPEPGFLRDFPHLTDLGAEWTRWRGTPFVFARWMVRKSVKPLWKRQLEDALETALCQFEDNRMNVVRQAARSLRVPFSRMDAYYRGLRYRLTAEETAGESAFRELLREGTEVLQ